MLDIADVIQWLREGNELDASNALAECAFSYDEIEDWDTRTEIEMAGFTYHDRYILKIEAPRRILTGLSGELKPLKETIERAVQQCAETADTNIEGIRCVPKLTSRDATGAQSAAPEKGEETSDMVEGDPTKVFVAHGRNQAVRNSMFSFLRAIGLHPIEWSEAVMATGSASPYVGEILDAAFAQARAVVILLTPDDEAYLREEYRTPDDETYETQPTPQARPNVIFEAGLAMGRRENRTVLVEVGSLRPFSNVAGRHILRLNNDTQRRQELAQRLQSAGCVVDLSGTDWHTTGNFEISD